MKRSFTAFLIWSLTGALLPACATDQSPWKDKFDIDPKHFASAGRNAYFILEPGYQSIFEGNEDGARVRLVITVLDETKPVDGVLTRVVEERETHNGTIAEVSRNYFAVDSSTHDVYYFGEDVDSYKDGKIASHAGSWLSGVHSARYGLVMPAAPRLGDRYCHELAPGVAMDRAEVASTTEAVTTPDGTFHHCVRSEETTPLEPASKEYKSYAPDIGLVRDGGLQLVKHGFTKP